jgi:hypothetical protein
MFQMELPINCAHQKRRRQAHLQLFNQRSLFRRPKNRLLTEFITENCVLRIIL